MGFLGRPKRTEATNLNEFIRKIRSLRSEVNSLWEKYRNANVPDSRLLNRIQAKQTELRTLEEAYEFNSRKQRNG